MAKNLDRNVAINTAKSAGRAEIAALKAAGVAKPDIQAERKANRLEVKDIRQNWTPATAESPFDPSKYFTSAATTYANNSPVVDTIGGLFSGTNQFIADNGLGYRSVQGDKESGITVKGGLDPYRIATNLYGDAFGGTKLGDKYKRTSELVDIAQNGMNDSQMSQLVQMLDGTFQYNINPDGAGEDYLKLNFTKGEDGYKLNGADNYVYSAPKVEEQGLGIGGSLLGAALGFWNPFALGAIANGALAGAVGGGLASGDMSGVVKGGLLGAAGGYLKDAGVFGGATSNQPSGWDFGPGLDKGVVDPVTGLTVDQAQALGSVTVNPIADPYSGITERTLPNLNPDTSNIDVKSWGDALDKTVTNKLSDPLLESQAPAPVVDKAPDWVKPGEVVNQNGNTYLGLPSGSALDLGSGLLGSTVAGLGGLTTGLGLGTLGTGLVAGTVLPPIIKTITDKVTGNDGSGDYEQRPINWDKADAYSSVPGMKDPRYQDYYSMGGDAEKLKRRLAMMGNGYGLLG